MEMENINLKTIKNFNHNKIKVLTFKILIILILFYSSVYIFKAVMSHSLIKTYFRVESSWF